MAHNVAVAQRLLRHFKQRLKILKKLSKKKKFNQKNYLKKKKASAQRIRKESARLRNDP